jgi:hypothetical protein
MSCSAQLSFASEKINAGFVEVKECPVKANHKSLIFYLDSTPARYAIVEANGDFISWESPREDEEAQKLLNRFSNR